MNLRPPPLPGSIGSSEPNGFAQHAANAALAAPLIVFGLTFCFNAILKDHHDSSARLLHLACGLADVGLGLLGFTLGILAMLLAAPGQRASVIPRASVGLALLGLLTAIAVPNFLRARTQALEQKQALTQLHSAAADLRARAVVALTNGQFVSADSGQLQRSLSQAAEKSSGETAALLRSTERYLQRMQSLQHAYGLAAKELKEAKVLAAETLQQRDQIQQRTMVVEKFLDANQACKDFIQHCEVNYSNQLAAGGISAAQLQAALNGFRKESAPQVPLVMSVREDDERIGQAMIGVLKLFDTQWGQWNYDATARLVRFQDRTALNQYKALLAEIRQAGTDQEATSKQLATVMSKGAGSRSL